MNKNTFEFIIKNTEWNVEKKVEYVGVNQKFNPAWMNFDYDEFNWGDWKDTWIIDKFKPCVLNSDGSVDYYLNRDDLTRSDDGRCALKDLMGTSGKNAMIEIGQFWIKESENASGDFLIKLSDHQIDEEYKCWTHYNRKNDLVDKIYYGMFQGSGDGDKLKSVSGRFSKHGLSGEEIRQMCRRNGNGWDCEDWACRRMILYVLVLLGRTTWLRDSFGWGYVRGNLGGIRSGGHEHRGLFWGDNSMKHHVTVLGIEDFWGNLSNLTNGILCNGEKNFYVKMTTGTADGSRGSDYSDNISDYVAIPRLDGSTSSGVPKKMDLMHPGFGLFPSEYWVNNDENYCDDVRFDKWNKTMCARCGGNYRSGNSVGPFSIDVSQKLSDKCDRSGACLIYRPTE